MTESKVIPVKVAVRSRPLNDRENDEGSRQCLQYLLKNGQISIDTRSFCFDAVFDPSADQESVYELCAAPLIDKLFDGYNCTIFAYGQTGSGKTFTMGTEQSLKCVTDHQQRGIIPRMVEEIFKKIDDLSDTFTISVSCSMLEIYEEKVLDLLTVGDKLDLAIREHPTTGIYVQDLSQPTVKTFYDTIKRLEQGCQIRTKGETAMNSKSSRSHAIFTVFIQKSSNTDESNSCRAKLNLVDLAGSERLKKTHAEGQRKLEGIRINEGLSALGNVISALTETSQQRTHIPYRDSKLTRLLQDSLGGNSHTVMIACVSPADSNHDETLNTLRYAERAKRIKNKPIVNLDPNTAEIMQLRQEVQMLQHQILQYENNGIDRNDGSTPYAMRDYEDKIRKNEKLEAEVQKLLNENTQLIADQAAIIQKLAWAECERDKFRDQIEELMASVNQNVALLENSADHSVLNEPKTAQITFLRDMHKKLDDLRNDRANQTLFDESDLKKETDDDEEFDEEHFRQGQVATSRQLESLLRQIKEKEEIISGEASNYGKMELLKANHEKQVAELKEKMEQLQQERTQLEQQLLNVKNNTLKISEQRRKRLQELEKQMTDYKKKMADLQKFEKMKQQNDQNMKKLRDEIIQLKQMRIQLLRQLRGENQKFREWQSKAERQMTQMKAKERRHEFEVQRAKRTYDQQLIVHKRKYEQAVAFTKRLQTQLQRQASVRKDRFNDDFENERLVKEMKKFIEDELDAVVSTEQAKMICESLIQQRKDLTKELRGLERKLENFDEKVEPPNKKQLMADGRSLDSSMEDDLPARIESLKHQISLTNVEIQELQRRISLFDGELGEERRWCTIHTIITAKCGLKVLFQLLVTAKCEGLQFENQLSDVRTNLEVLAQSMKDRENEFKLTEKRFERDRQDWQERISSIERLHNNKVSYLLSQFFTLVTDGHVEEGELKKIVQMHCEEAEKIQHISEQLEQAHEDKLRLKKELTKVNVRRTTTRSGQYFGNVAKKRNSNDGFLKPKRLRTSRTRQIQSPARLGEAVALNESFIEDEQDENEASSDAASDSDYRETPIHKRSIKLTEEVVPESKRRATFSVQNSCKCRRGACSTMLCGCSKRNEKCTEKCGCASEVCKNREEAEALNAIGGSTLESKDKTYEILPVVDESPEVSTNGNILNVVPVLKVTTPNSSSPVVETKGLASYNRKTMGGKLFKPVTPSPSVAPEPAPVPKSKNCRLCRKQHKEGYVCHAKKRSHHKK